MSFGFSVGDFVTIGQLTWNVYKGCKAAPQEFQELAREFSSLHTILHELEDEAKTPLSLLNRRGAERRSELDTLLANLSATLENVEDIVDRYHSLGRDQKKTWDRVKFATQDLADLRSRLQSHISGINLFISSLSAGSLGRIEGLLDELVKDIRAGRKEPSIVSTYEDNDELAWDELEKELIGDGITMEDVRQHKEKIRNYLRKLVEASIGDDINSEPVCSSYASSIRSLDRDSLYSIVSEPDILAERERGSESLTVLRRSIREAGFEGKPGGSRDPKTLRPEFRVFFSTFLQMTDPDGDYWDGDYLANPGRRKRHQRGMASYREQVNEVALSYDPSEPFNYGQYRRLGYAASPMCIRTLPLGSVFGTLKTYTSANKAAEAIRCTLSDFSYSHSNFAYLEIPGGFRCRPRPSGAMVYSYKEQEQEQEQEFLVMVVKLPVVRLYGIVFQDLNRCLLDHRNHAFLKPLAYYITHPVN